MKTDDAWLALRDVVVLCGTFVEMDGGKEPGVLRKAMPEYKHKDSDKRWI